MSEVPMQSRPIAHPLDVGALTQAQQYTSELKVKLEARHFNFFYGAFQALDDITLAMRERSITAIIGPSGCGKSTLLRAINRMHDGTPGARGQGELLLDGQNIYGPATDPVLLRRRPRGGGLLHLGFSRAIALVRPVVYILTRG